MLQITLSSLMLMTLRKNFAVLGMLLTSSWINIRKYVKSMGYVQMKLCVLNTFSLPDRQNCPLYLLFYPI